MDLKFYTVNDEYIQYLHITDRKVELHHSDGKMKPYVGIVMSVGTYNYFIPLSSPKPKHQTMREDLTFVKILDGNNLIAVMNINNMIPVPDFELQIYNFDEHSQKHKDLLNKEYNEVKRISKKIIKNANKLYHLVTNYPEDNRRNVSLSCDFKLLEQKSVAYIQEKSKLQVL